MTFGVFPDILGSEEKYKEKGLLAVQFWQAVLAFLDTPMQTPEPYGWFHLVWFALSVLAIIPLVRYAKNPQKVIWFTAVAVVLLEVYKQINYSFSYAEGISFDYQWYAFPFQFCSTPMYVGLLAGLVLLAVKGVLKLTKTAKPV